MAGDSIVIDGKTFISSKRAASLTGYTKDYVGQLSRSGKIAARLIGRNWYIDEASLMSHKEEGRRSRSEMESDRQQRQDKLMKELNIKQHPVTSFSIEADDRPNIPTLNKVDDSEPLKEVSNNVPISTKRDLVKEAVPRVREDIPEAQVDETDKYRKVNLMHMGVLVVLLLVFFSIFFSVLETTIVYNGSELSSSLKLATASYSDIVALLQEGTSRAIERVQLLLGL